MIPKVLHSRVIEECVNYKQVGFIGWEAEAKELDMSSFNQCFLST